MIWFFLLILFLFGGVVWLAWSYLQRREAVQYRIHILPTATHGVLDFLIGAFLTASPWLLGFAAGGAETWVPVGLGIGLLLYSLFTDYEWGMVRLLPMPAHLVLDGVVGLFLFASPMVFGFVDEVLNPHLGLGVLVMGLALITRPAPSAEESAAARSGARDPGEPPPSTHTHSSVNEGGHKE